jgi:hypothetical protein
VLWANCCVHLFGPTLHDPLTTFHSPSSTATCTPPSPLPQPTFHRLHPAFTRIPLPSTTFARLPLTFATFNRLPSPSPHLQPSLHRTLRHLPPTFTPPSPHLPPPSTLHPHLLAHLQPAFKPPSPHLPPVERQTRLPSLSTSAWLHRRTFSNDLSDFVGRSDGAADRAGGSGAADSW